MREPATYETYLNETGRLIGPFKGTSMLPMLRQGKDVFIVEKSGTDRCKRGDVVLYRRPPDQYVLHRIIAVRESDYVILGDNCIAREYGITDADILGVMTGFIRNGKEHSVHEFGYRAYCAIWMRTRALRVGWLRLKGAVRRKFK